MTESSLLLSGEATRPGQEGPRSSWRVVIIQSLISTALYAALGNARGLDRHPLFEIEGAHVAVWMVVPVIAGSLGGLRTGALVGILGPMTQYLTPGGTNLDLLNTLPHCAMGCLAGHLGKHHANPIPALALILGHVLNAIVFSIAGVWGPETWITPSIYGLVAQEIAVGIVVVTVVVNIVHLVGHSRSPRDPLSQALHREPDSFTAALAHAHATDPGPAEPQKLRYAASESTSSSVAPASATKHIASTPSTSDSTTSNATAIRPLTTELRVWILLGFLALALTLVFALCLYFTSLFLTFVLGTLLMVLTDQMAQDLRTRFPGARSHQGIRRALAIGQLAAWAAATAIVLNRSLGELVDTVALFRERREVLTNTVTGLAGRLPESLVGNLFSTANLDSLREKGIDILSGVGSQASSFLFNSLLIIPLMFSMVLRKRAHIARHLTLRVPKIYRGPFAQAAAQTIAQLRQYAHAKAVESLIVGAICCLGFFLFGVRGWLLLGMLAGLLNIIPYLGPLLGLLPPLAVTLISDQSWVMFGVAGTVAVAQAVDNFYIIPFVISGEVKINPLVAIVLTLVGADLFGVMGMTFAIPIYLVYRIVLTSFYAAFTNPNAPGAQSPSP